MPENIQIIAQVGDTHGLRFEDMGKRRFLRLGASEKMPNTVQGTLHTGAIFDPEGATVENALALLGLTFFDSKKHPKWESGLFSLYYVTGAIAYLAGDEGDELLGIIASVREVPSETTLPDPDDAEFERQYPGASADNSIAKELDALLEAWERSREVATEPAQTRTKIPYVYPWTGQIGKLFTTAHRKGGVLDAGQIEELDGLIDSIREARDLIRSSDEDDDPELVHGRLN